MFDNKLNWATALCAVVVLIVLGMPSYARGAVHLVDDDKVQCPTATFTSIQLAVADPTVIPGDTIRVCPGTYNENVTVPKTLTITGTLAGSALNRCFGTPSPPNPASDAIVQGIGPNLYGFGLVANGIILENFVIQLTNNGPGVYWSPAFSGYVTRNNIIQLNTIGLYPNSSGAMQSVARLNCFRANNDPGASSGDAIYADQGSRNILIERNRSTLHNSAAAVFAGAPGTQMDITYRLNELRDDNSIVLFNTARGTVALNVITNSVTTSGTGILVGGNNDTVLVTGNLINGAGGSGVSVSAGFGANRNVDVILNFVRTALNGVRVSDPSPGVAEIRWNALRENRTDGVRMELATSLNTIADNVMRRNVEHDCHDDSVGPNSPPALVANFWIRNDGVTENRPGLCRGRAKHDDGDFDRDDGDEDEISDDEDDDDDNDGRADAVDRDDDNDGIDDEFDGKFTHEDQRLSTGSLAPGESVDYAMTSDLYTLTLIGSIESAGPDVLNVQILDPLGRVLAAASMTSGRALATTAPLPPAAHTIRITNTGLMPVDYTARLIRGGLWH